MIRIVVYETLDHAAPEAMRYAAAMVPDKKVPGSHWMATGRTPDEARGKLEAMWLREHPADRSKAAETMDDLV